MRPRPPYAMEQLVTEISALYPKAEFEYGHLDGLGVYHSVRVTGEGLSDLEEALAEMLKYASRIAGLEDHDDYLVVRFLAHPAQWSRVPFNLAVMVDAVQARHRPAKKTARKRAAKKNPVETSD